MYVTKMLCHYYFLLIIYSQFLFNSQHTSVIDMKSMEMMSRNLQGDVHFLWHNTAVVVDDDCDDDDEATTPADVGDIITNWVEFDEIFSFLFYYYFYIFFVLSLSVYLSICSSILFINSWKSTTKTAPLLLCWYILFCCAIFFYFFSSASLRASLLI